MLTRVYIWIIVNFESSLRPFVEELKGMLKNSNFMEVSREELRASLTNFIIDNVLRAKSSILGIERVLLANFLLAPMLATSDDSNLEILKKHILNRTKLGLERFNWKAYFTFIKSCVICNEGKKSFLKNLEDEKIDATDAMEVFDNFFNGTKRGWDLYDSLIEMFRTLHSHKDMVNFYATLPESKKMDLLNLSSQVRDFLDRVVS